MFIQWYNGRRQQKSMEEYARLIMKSNQLCLVGGTIEAAELESLYRKLKPTRQLIAYERALSQFQKENKDMTAYLLQVEPVMKDLVFYYRRKNEMEQAYLAWFIATHAKDCWQNPIIYQTLISFMDHSTIYLRENILQATYRQPDVKWIVKAYEKLTIQNQFHHPKLIQDGLLQFPYDAETLIRELWDQRMVFHPSIVQGVIGYITYKSDSYKEAFYHLLTSESLDLEMQTRLMRYFKNHHYPKVENLLQTMVTDEQATIRIVAVQVLSSYPSENVKKTLKRALTDANWYVRYNASQSLLKMELSEMDVLDIVNGPDTFAKEMLHYHLSEEGRQKI